MLEGRRTHRKTAGARVPPLHAPTPMRLLIARATPEMITVGVYRRRDDYTPGRHLKRTKWGHLPSHANWLPVRMAPKAPTFH